MHENELKEEVSPVKQKFAEFSTSFLAFFARNFYNFKSAALIISFLLNLILLSLKWEAKGDAEDSDVAQETDFDQERKIIFVHLLNFTNSFSKNFHTVEKKVEKLFFLFSSMLNFSSLNISSFHDFTNVFIQLLLSFMFHIDRYSHIWR